MKLFVSIYAALIDAQSLSENLGITVDISTLGKVRLEDKAYLSSECRALEVFKRKGLVPEIEKGLFDILPEVESLFPGFERQLEQRGLQPLQTISSCI